MNFFTQFSTWTGKVWALLLPINHQLNFMAPFFTLEYVEFSSDCDIARCLQTTKERTSDPSCTNATCM